jgi:hypothetical protein
MPLAACPACQARYKVPDSATGKRTTCRKCGESFRIPAMGEASESRHGADRARVRASTRTEGAGIGLDDFEALTQGRLIERAPSVGAADQGDAGGAADRVSFLAGGPPSSALAAGSESDEYYGLGYFNYLRAVGQSLLFFRRPSAIAVFAFLWVLLAMREVMQAGASIAPSYLGGGIASIGAFIIWGWYMSFQMRLVQFAAGGDKELPALNAEEDIWDGVIIPSFQMLVTNVLVLLPAGFYVMILTYRMTAAVASSPGALFSGASPVPSTSAVVVLIILSLAGLFMWPMMVLVVSCGSSVAALFQLDLILATVLKSFPAYLLSVIAVYASFGVRVAITLFVWNNVVPTTSWRDQWTNIILLPALFSGIDLFFNILAMRAIGYYYCCFKDKFAWSWG